MTPWRAHNSHSGSAAPGLARPWGVFSPSAPSPVTWARFLGSIYRTAFMREVEERRLFLWLPVCFGAGVLLYFSAEREPVLWLALLFGLGAGAGAFAVRHRSQMAMGVLIALSALWLGFAAAGLRAQAIAGPVLHQTRILTVSGLVEEVDIRRTGARLVLRLTRADSLPQSARPIRVRLTMRARPDFAAGDAVTLKARLQSPPTAALPAGYDFARDAYFERIGAVGSVLGTVHKDAPMALSVQDTISAMLDQWRNALAARVDAVIRADYAAHNGLAQGEAMDTGAIGAAMVTGKRDYLSFEAKDLIREAGIFHLITISGLQMSLVAGLVFFFARFGFVCLCVAAPALAGLAETLPIRAVSAIMAMVATLAYNALTGARIGTLRALLMVLLMLGAGLVGRRASSMRVLALVALGVLALAPETMLAAGFHLSFAAVAALIAAFESRLFSDQRLPLAQELADLAPSFARPTPRGHEGVLAKLRAWLDNFVRTQALARARLILTSTLCASLATACFMAYDFHEVSPYVLIGNPATLLLIEVFAVPAALIGMVLAPLGLDAFLWHYLGFGIGLVLAFAHFLASLPFASLPVRAFGAGAMACFVLALLNTVLWRTLAMRLIALPLLALGAVLAAGAPHQDLFIDADGVHFAVRQSDGLLWIGGKGTDGFAAVQWLRADGDARAPQDALLPQDGCDAYACLVVLPQGGVLSYVIDARAFLEDCARADVIVTPLIAPPWCAQRDNNNLREVGARHPVRVYDRLSLSNTGAVAVTFARAPAADSLENAEGKGQGLVVAHEAFAHGEDTARPWQRPALKERRMDGGESQGAVTDELGAGQSAEQGAEDAYP